LKRVRKAQGKTKEDFVAGLQESKQKVGHQGRNHQATKRGNIVF